MHLHLAPEDGVVHLTHPAVFCKCVVMMMGMIRPSPGGHLPPEGRTRYEAKYMGLDGARRNSPKGSPPGGKQLRQPSSNSGRQGLPPSRTKWEILLSYP